MTVTRHPTTTLAAESAALEAVAVDIYRDIHKGIRAELFARHRRRRATSTRADRAVARGSHERLTQPRRRCSSARRARGHVRAARRSRSTRRTSPRSSPATTPRLEARMASLEVLADRAVDAGRRARRRVTRTTSTSELASFTARVPASTRTFEELEVMPALSRGDRRRRAARHRPGDRREHPARRDGDVARAACSRR